MRTVVHTHEPPLARPAEFFDKVWRDLRRSRPLASEIAKRDIRTQYRHSLLGPTAVLLLPLALTALAVGFHRSGILRVDTATDPYVLYVLVGVVLWTSFIEALNAPSYGLLSELRLLSRTTAPPEAIVLGKLGPVFVNLLLKLLLVAAALLWYRMPIPISAALAPIGILGLVRAGHGHRVADRTYQSSVSRHFVDFRHRYHSLVLLLASLLSAACKRTRSASS